MFRPVSFELPALRIDPVGKMKDYRGLFCVVALLLLAPLLFVDYLPMVDVPGHLARIHILRNYDQVPQFREVYEIHGKPVPATFAYRLITAYLPPVWGYPAIFWLRKHDHL